MLVKSHVVWSSMIVENPSLRHARRMTTVDRKDRPSLSDEERTALGARVDERRKAANLSQADLAEAAGFRLLAISDLINGKTANPSIALLQAVARALNTPVSDLVGDAREESRVVLDSDADMELIDRVIADTGLNADQAERLRGARWSRGTSEATLRSYAVDLLREGKVPDRAVANKVVVPDNLKRFDLAGEAAKKKR